MTANERPYNLRMDDDDSQKRRASDHEWISVAEIASRVGVTPPSVYRWIKMGYLKAIRLGPRAYRIRREDFDAFLAAGGVVPEGGEGGDDD
jgi:excisionase family DNA binding protein